MPRERGVDNVRVPIVQAGAKDGGREVIQVDDAGHAAEIVERVFMQTEERLPLISDRFLIAMPRVTQDQPEYPRSPPLAGGVQRRRALEEIDLPSSSGADANRTTRCGQ